MAKKDLASVTGDLSALAATLPTQRATPAETRTPTEAQIQFSFSLRKELRKELARLAADADMTMRGFVLLALRDKGLRVRDEDLLDLRKEQK